MLTNVISSKCEFGQNVQYVIYYLLICTNATHPKFCLPDYFQGFRNGGTVGDACFDFHCGRIGNSYGIENTNYLWIMVSELQ